jgi:mannose-6-phosphate isomerase-like protein (cupin superfamily)
MTDVAIAPIPITGRQLALPPGPIFHLQKAVAGYEIGAFRPWAGYKDFGTAAATDGLALFQHVLSFGPTDQGGRTGVHAHLAHAHIVIPTSGRALFSYDGVITEAVPGSVIVQHGGTVHDQFLYSYASATVEENSRTPIAVEPAPAGAPLRSFGFLELFVPAAIAHVEIVPPKAVTGTDQRTAWRHPYHAEGARFAVQRAEDPDAAYRPVAGHPDLEARDGKTWRASGGLVATWIVRPASSSSAGAPPLALSIPGEDGGLDILFMASGSARVMREDGEDILLQAGDCLTCSQGLVGAPHDASPDMRLVRFFIPARAQALRQRTPAEIEALQRLGPAIITARELREDGDLRPVNVLREG